jgi:hypothetical protein
MKDGPMSQTEGMDERVAQTRVARRRQVNRVLLAPMIGIGVLIGVALVVVLLLPRPSQVQIVADNAIAWLVLCPLNLCMMPLYLIMVLTAYAMNPAHDALERQLQRLENAGYSFGRRVRRLTERATVLGNRLRTRWARWQVRLSIFERPQNTRVDSEKETKR